MTATFTMIHPTGHYIGWVVGAHQLEETFEDTRRAVQETGFVRVVALGSQTLVLRPNGTTAAQRQTLDVLWPRFMDSEKEPA